MRGRAETGSVPQGARPGVRAYTSALQLNYVPCFQWLSGKALGLPTAKYIPGVALTDAACRFPIAGRYRVEVSGWDKNQAFFVEKYEAARLPDPEAGNCRYVEHCPFLELCLAGLFGCFTSHCWLTWPFGSPLSLRRQLPSCVNSLVKSARPNCSAEGRFSQVDAEGLCPLLPNDTKREPCCLRLWHDQCNQEQRSIDRFGIARQRMRVVGGAPGWLVDMKQRASLERIPAQRGDVVSAGRGVSRKGSRQL
jgi:hypothetical protein